MKLSITIIGHNESYHLKELLPQLKWADEVIYVDCDSKDDSLIIAGNFGCKTFSRPNNPNLNINKSYAIDQAKGDWIFYLDPDERIPDELSNEILSVIASDRKKSAYRLNRRNFYFKQWLRHGSQYPDTQLRLFKRGCANFPNKHVHEKLEIDGDIGKLENDMLHFPYLDIRQYLFKLNFYTTFEADFLFEKGVKLNIVNHFRFLFFIPMIRFVRRYFLKFGFLDGFAGLFASMFDSLNFMICYFKLWENYRCEKK